MIYLYRSLNEALSEVSSPYNTQFISRGIHLLPNNEAKYVQQTNTEGGISLEDWTVYIVDCKGTKTNVSSYFLVEKLVNASDGTPQIVWSLLDVPFDFGWKLVHLEINQTLGETFYSNRFMLTDVNKDKTVQLHYKKEKNDDFLSIGVTMYYSDEDKKTELKTYYEISTKITTTYGVKTSKFDIYNTELMQKSLLVQLSDIFEYPYCYLDGIRHYLFEAITIPPKKGSENYGQTEIKLSKNVNDKFGLQADYLDIDYGEVDYFTGGVATGLIFNNIFNDIFG